MAHTALRNRYPGMFGVDVTNDADKAKQVKSVRDNYVELADMMLKALPEGRAKSLAMTYLEESLMRAVQSVCLG